MHPWRAGVLFVGVISCRDPTQFTLRIDTDVACEDLVGVTIAVDDESSVELRDPQGRTTSCNAGEIGTLVVVPGDERDARLGLRVIGGVNVDARSCKAPKYETAEPDGGCIVARRALSFIPYQSLDLPISLRRSCVGEPCTSETTCVDGECADRRVAEECDGDVCGEDALTKCGAPHDCAGDANNDGSVDQADVDVVTSSLGTACGEAGYDPRADLDGDLIVDDEDLELASVFGDCVCTAPTTCVGDLNGDGFIDAGDIGVLSANACAGMSEHPEDLNRDGMVDDADLDVLVSLLGCTCETVCTGCAPFATCEGDVNADGLIDDADLALLTTLMFKGCTTDPDYFHNADLNRDFVVDGADFGILNALVASGPMPCP